MGFLPDIRRILKALPHKRQTLLFSATIPDAIASLARELMRDPVTVRLERRSTPAAGIRQAIYPVPRELKSNLLKELLALPEFREVQIVATTHSPYILDQLDPEDVYAFALRDNGSVASRKLSKHPSAASSKGVLGAGQLWSLDPEKDWVLKGNE